MKQEITSSQFMDAFKQMERDYYGYEGYKALFDYYDEIEGFELDVVAICCEVTEYDEEDLINDYGYLVDKEDFQEDEEAEELTEEEQEEYLAELLNQIETKTNLITLDNDSFLIWDF